MKYALAAIDLIVIGARQDDLVAAGRSCRAWLVLLMSCLPFSMTGAPAISPHQGGVDHTGQVVLPTSIL